MDETKQCVLREEFNSVLGNLSPEDITKEPSEWVFNVIQGTKPNVEERGKIYTKLETYLQSQNYVISEDETTIPPEQQWVAKSKVDNYLDTQTLEELNALTDEDFALVDWDPKPGVLILYEFTIDADETDPTLKISYPETSRNAKFTPAAMDYDNDTFEYGDWKDAFFMPKPVMLDFDGNVDQELVEDNYIQKTQPYMTDETMGEFITTCTQVHEDLQPKQGTWEHENITWDRYYNNIIITRPDSKYNIICIAPKERFVKEFLDMEDIVATTLPNYVKTLVGTLTINVNNTNIVTAITNAKATGDVGKWLTQIQEYLTLYVLNGNTCTTCYILGTNDFVALIAQGATIRANYTPAFNNGTLGVEDEFNQLRQDLIAETDKLYQDKNSIYYVPELGDSKYILNKPTLWGTAVEEDGVISGFSNTSWASFTKPFSPEGNWEVAVQFKLDAINVAQYIFGSNCSYQPFSMSITAANQLYISAYKNNANTVLFAALTSVNTLSDMDIGNEFIARAVYNTETGYYFEIKAVKDSGKTLSVSTSTVEPITGGFGLLFGIDGAGVDVYNAQPLKGCIDIKGSYAKYEVDGEEVYYWKGKEDIDLAKDCTEVDGKYYLTKYIPKEEKWLPAEQFQTCTDTFNKAYNMITNWEKQYTLNSDVANIEFAGNAMVQFPQVWIKYETEQIEQELEAPKTIYHVSVANHKAGDGFNCYTHTNKYGKLVDSIYINIYQPYKDTTTYGTTDIPLMRSISGQTTTVSNTTANEILWAENTTNLSNNITYSVLDLGMVEMLYVLGLLMGKNTNLSSVFGFGVGSGNAGIAKCGDGDQKGLFYGTKTRGVLKYFGIENHWGNYWKVINGLFYTTTDGLLAKLTETQIDGTTVNGYTQDGSGYRKIGLISGTSNNYIQEIKVDEHGIYPSTLSSTAGVQYCDGVWYANNGFAAFGGSYADGEKCGPFAFTLDAGITRSGASTGGSLAAKPNN